MDIVGNIEEGLDSGILAETSIVTDNFIMFTAENSDTTGTIEQTLLSMKVTVDPPTHGLENPAVGMYQGKYGVSLFPGTEIVWMDPKFNMYTETSWDDVPPPGSPTLFTLISFTDSPIRSINAKFTVEIEYEEIVNDPMAPPGPVDPEIKTKTKEFTQLCTYDWTAGRDAMASYRGTMENP
jgi:hypothetical protein